MFIQGEKYRWIVPKEDKHKAAELASRFNLSASVIQVLLSRNYDTPQKIEGFLFSRRETEVACPRLLKDAQKAVNRIMQALEKEEKILICGDYDVDGITSASLMLLCLLPLKAHINFFLPNRVRDGYGLSVKTVERAARNGYKVIVTVDNGITAFEPALRAQELGIDLIITDHHRPHHELPKAFAIVNPYQKDCTYPFKNFAGVGVIFKLMSLLYEQLNLPLPSQVIELMLLGTIADVVPLTGENRFWVRLGLARTRLEESTALRVLKQQGRINKPLLTSTDIGFFITPQINALGRLDDPRDGVKFLMSTNTEEVERIGHVLASLNEERRRIERSILSAIEQELQKKSMSEERVIIASHTEWAPGVIGLVASRLVGIYNRPVFLFHITPEGIAKGSCRSIAKLNIFSALTQVNDLLITFGGHAAAAGLSLHSKNLDEFKSRIERVIDTMVKPEDFHPTLYLDAELTLPEATTHFAQNLMYLQPFGCENSVPIFYVRNASVIEEPQLLKDAHVKCKIFSEGVIKPVIFFNRPELYKKIREALQQSCDVAVHVIENYWNDQVRIELQGIDIFFH